MMHSTTTAAATGLAMMIFLGGCAGDGVEGGVHRAAFGDAEVVYEFHNADPEAGEERTALVFVHGWACDRGHWDSTIERLPRDRAALTLDLPGYGQSSDGGAEHTMDLYAAGILAAMDDAGIGEAVLVGHSMGTPAVRQVYRLAPERVAGLVAVDGALALTMTEEQAMQVAGPLFTDEWQAFAARMFDGMSATMAHEADRARVREVMLATSRHAMRGGFTAMYSEGVWEDDPIGAPVLLALAEAPFWDEAYLSRVRALAPGLTIEMFPGASHFVMMDQPGRFVEVVVGWLEHRGL